MIKINNAAVTSNKTAIAAAPSKVLPFGWFPKTEKAQINCGITLNPERISHIPSILSKMFQNVLIVILYVFKVVLLVKPFLKFLNHCIGFATIKFQGIFVRLVGEEGKEFFFAKT